MIQTYSLWVELEKIPLGRHWFQLRSIKVHGLEIQVHLKYLRMFQANERKSLDVIEYQSIDYREVRYINFRLLNFLKVMQYKIVHYAKREESV